MAQRIVCCKKTDCKTWTKENALLLATIAGVIFGVVLGIAMREANLSKLDIEYFAFPGEMLLRMLKMMIVPLIVCSLITGTSHVTLNLSHSLKFKLFDQRIRRLIFYRGGKFG